MVVVGNGCLGKVVLWWRGRGGVEREEGLNRSLGKIGEVGWHFTLDRGRVE